MSSAAENMRQAASDLLGVKGAIIEKGVEVPYGTPTSKYADKIREIETGITPSGTISITENGDYNVTEYAEASVHVSGGGSGATLNATFDVESGVLNRGELSVEGELTLTIPDGVAEIGEGAFGNNANIELATTLNIPNSVTTIGGSAFSGCVNLRNLVIPNSVTAIGAAAFELCKRLTDLTIPSSVVNIGEYAFTDCPSLTSLTIQYGVENIGNGAFNGCENLLSLTIPSSVTNIGEYAFNVCDSLTDIYYTGTQAEWEAITGIANAGFKGTETIHYNYTGDGSEL